MTTVTYSIPSINCSHCVHTITSELSDLPGVKTVSGDVAAKQVTVSFEPPATTAEMEKLLAEINFPVSK